MDIQTDRRTDRGVLVIRSHFTLWVRNLKINNAENVYVEKLFYVSHDINIGLYHEIHRLIIYMNHYNIVINFRLIKNLTENYAVLRNCIVHCYQPY